MNKFALSLLLVGACAGGDNFGAQQGLNRLSPPAFPSPSLCQNAAQLDIIGAHTGASEPDWDSGDTTNDVESLRIVSEAMLRLDNQADEVSGEDFLTVEARNGMGEFAQGMRAGQFNLGLRSDPSTCELCVGARIQGKQLMAVQGTAEMTEVTGYGRISGTLTNVVLVETGNAPTLCVSLPSYQFTAEAPY